MEKNVILAIVLSVVVLIGYNLLVSTHAPPPEKEEEIYSPAQKETETLFPEETPSKEEAKEFTIENDALKITINSKGGVITSWYLKKSEKELINRGASALGLNLLLPSGENIDLNREYFQIKLNKEGREATCEWENREDKYKIVKIFKILPKKHYGLITIKTEGLPMVSEYQLSWQGGIGEKYEEEERLAFFRGTLEEEKEEGIKSNYSQGIKWMGMRQKKDFLVILASLNQPLGGVFTFNSWGFKHNKIKSEWIIYAGPQDYYQLRTINERIKRIQGEDYHLTEAVKLSFWSYLSIGLIKVLLFFYSFTHNYGIAIILLTLLIYGVLSPLTFKQFKSMQKMQEVQPHLKTIQKKFKNDPKKLQAEMMNTYKKYGINPMSGCLPMVVQLPIIFILYRALLGFDFSENPSFLWIKDLSEPNIPLLLILGVVMFIQQRAMRKMQPQGGQEGLSKIMQFFPIFLIVILWSLPSGVMLYWFVSTLFSTLQQFLILKKSPKPAVKKG
ncbi:MAG: membrane protein insertase YidC [Candidatus Aerophobetes bacterium]|nr:membrane protein insertase YidC [Candidatus Aerophobetes bacterium]